MTYFSTRWYLAMQISVAAPNQWRWIEFHLRCKTAICLLMNNVLVTKPFCAFLFASPQPWRRGNWSWLAKTMSLGGIFAQQITRCNCDVWMEAIKDTHRGGETLKKPDCLSPSSNDLLSVWPALVPIELFSKLSCFVSFAHPPKKFLSL